MKHSGFKRLNLLASRSTTYSKRCLHPVNKHLPSPYYEPSTLLGAGKLCRGEDRVLAVLALTVQQGRGWTISRKTHHHRGEEGSRAEQSRGGGRRACRAVAVRWPGRASRLRKHLSGSPQEVGKVAMWGSTQGAFRTPAGPECGGSEEQPGGHCGQGARPGAAEPHRSDPRTSLGRGCLQPRERLVDCSSKHTAS